MAIALKLLAQAELSANPATVYTAPNGVTGMLKSLVLAGTSASDAPARVHLVPPGGQPLPSNALLFDVAVPGNGITAMGHLVVIPAGYRLVASGAGVTLTASGAEQ